LSKEIFKEPFGLLTSKVDQTPPSKFIPTDNVTMAEKSSKRVSRKGRGAFQPWTHSCPGLYGYLVFFGGNKEQILLLDVVVFYEIIAKNIKFVS